jgi:hypothetical protein
VEIGDVGQQPQRRPGQVEQHRAAEAKMRPAGFLGHHPPRDKEHHRASPKCRRESTPQPRITLGISILQTPIIRGFRGDNLLERLVKILRIVRSPYFLCHRHKTRVALGVCEFWLR